MTSPPRIGRTLYALELTEAEAVALARYLEDHGNPRYVPALRSLRRKALELRQAVYDARDPEGAARRRREQVRSDSARLDAAMRGSCPPDLTD